MPKFNWVGFGWGFVALATLVSLLFLFPGESQVSFRDVDEGVSQASPARWFYPRGHVATPKLVSLGGHFHGMVLLWPGPTLVAANHLGIFLSGDRGISWQLLEPDFAVHGMGRVVATSDGRALVMTGEGAGLKRSEDGGATWRPVHAGFPPGLVKALAMDPANGNRLLLWIDRSLAHSEDGGRTWFRVPPETALPRVLSLAFHPEEPNRFYAGTQRGVWMTADGGHSWSPPGPDAPMVPVFSVAVPPGRAGLLVAGTGEGPFVGSLDFSWWRSLPSPVDEFGPIVAFAFGVRDRDRVLAMTHQGQVLQHSLAELLTFSEVRWTALHLASARSRTVEFPPGELWFTP